MLVLEAWPTVSKVITQPWGARPEAYKRFGWSGGHEGIDIRAPLHTPIYAAAAGKITAARNTRRDGRPSAYGWHVIIEHDDGYQTLYAHLREDAPGIARPGAQVKAGQLVGYSGNTGNSQGAHLHFSVKKAGARTPGFLPGYVDPTPFIQAFLSRPPEEQKRRPVYPSHITKEQIL